MRFAGVLYLRNLVDATDDGIKHDMKRYIRPGGHMDHTNAVSRPILRSDPGGGPIRSKFRGA